VIQPRVLTTLERNQQFRPRDTEAGGQLFGRLIDNQLSVELATGPRPTDIRTRYSYKPDRRAEQVEIDRYHRQGLLFLGDWHTHPEPCPSPSPQDLQSIREAFKESTHHLNGLMLVIAGTLDLPSGLYVAVHNDREDVRLVPRVTGSSISQSPPESAS
jgi:integrative and conjugative element protein (TIGR02256 family)